MLKPSSGGSRRILFGASPATGHLLPMLPLADAAAAAGHPVVFLTAAEMAPLLGSRPHLPAGSGLGELLESFLAEGHPHPYHLGDSTIRFTGGYRIEDSLDAAVEQARTFGPELVICEISDFVGPLVAATLGIPWVRHNVAGAVDPALRKGMDDELFDNAAARSLALPLYSSFLEIYPELLYRPGDFTPDDYPPVADRLAMRPEPPAISFPTDQQRAVPPRTPGRARALLTLGTTTLDEATLVHTLSLAAAEAGVDVLVTAAPEAVPEHPLVHAIGRTPLRSVLTEVDLVISAAGSGTFLTSLGAGVPMVLFSQVADQHLNAARAAHHGAVVSIDSAEAATDAVRRVATDPSFRAAAGTIAKAVTAMPSPAEVLPEVLRRAGLA